MAHSHSAGAASLPAHRIFACAAAILAGVKLKSTGVRASQVTACTKLDLCYCVDTDYRGAITDKVARVRGWIAGNKEFGKAVGLFTVPMSPALRGGFCV